MLVCFAIVGFTNSLGETGVYSVAALFPVDHHTQGVHVGNVWSGVVNVVVAAALRLAIGGVRESRRSTTLSFYLFFTVLVVVNLAAIVAFNKLLRVPCVKFLLGLAHRFDCGCEPDFRDLTSLACGCEFGLSCRQLLPLRLECLALVAADLVGFAWPRAKRASRSLPAASCARGSSTP